MDGYTYIKKVLERDALVLDTLLSKLKKHENSAVEFKASFIPQANSDDNADECSWNVISDIIAIANSAGGCILLGVNDEGEYAEGYLGKHSLDSYKRSLNDHIGNKKEWSFKGKKFFIENSHRNTLQNCIKIHDGKLNEKDILVIHIKPSNRVIIYKEQKSAEESEPREYITYRAKTAVPNKEQVPFTSESVDRYNNREKDSDYFDQLWSEYIGKQEKNVQGRFCFRLSVLAILITVLQVFFIYTDVVTDCTAKGFDHKFLILLSSLPFFAIVDLLIFFVMNRNRNLILCNLNLCYCSFSIAAFSYVLKLFNQGNEFCPYSLGIRIVISALLFIGIFLFCFFLMPILVPVSYKCKNINSALPKPDEIDIKHPHLTWEGKCVDGNFWWESKTWETPYGEWKFQTNKVFGNCRLLDPRAIMRCYGTKEEVSVEFKKVKEIYPKGEK